MTDEDSQELNNVPRYVTLLWQKRSLNYYYFLFFSSNNFLYNVNGIRFLRNDVGE